MNQPFFLHLQHMAFLELTKKPLKKPIKKHLYIKTMLERKTNTQKTHGGYNCELLFVSLNNQCV